MSSSEGERKQITINPEHFKIASGTRKKREPTTPKIKVKAPPKKEKKAKASTLKRNLVKMLRNFQEDQEKKNRKKDSKPLLVSNNNDKQQSQTPLPAKSDFESSVEFFQSLEKAKQDEAKHRQPKPRQNFTLKSHTPTAEPTNVTNVSAVGQPISISNPHHVNNNHPTMHVKPPPYGCLKNGSKPTYRVWRRQTQKNYPAPNPSTPIQQQHNSSTIPKPHPKPFIPKSILSVPPSPKQMNYENQLRDTIREMSLHEQHDKFRQKQLQQQLPKSNTNSLYKKRKKQRRILRRTFRTGKSKVHPRVSVLVSNKTIRNNTNLKMTELRETPIRDVKQFLKKQGFIKVGTNTPNDVLRQMYECANLICGEVKNHNSENLLYNYFNDDTEML